jgi:hypothetical protein
MTVKLNAYQESLIRALKQNGGWLAQDELAQELGKTHLSPEDVMQLDLLGEAGLLIKETNDNRAQGENVRYRFTEPKADAHTNVERHTDTRQEEKV